MDKPESNIKLSVLVPGIRTQNWSTLYNSVQAAFNGDWEMIFISPYDLPKHMRGLKNIKHLYDWGTPIRCQQLGLLHSKGEFISWAADDGYYSPNSINIAFEKLYGQVHHSTLVMGKYLEGHANHAFMRRTAYYILNNHDGSRVKYLPSRYLMLNVGIVPRKLLMDVGGWDCQFEVCPMSYNDLAIRLQNYGVKFIVQDEIMFHCSHLPARQGDHGPIHDAQTIHDMPLFKQIYSTPDCINRVHIDIDNWQKSPERWGRRFGNLRD